MADLKHCAQMADSNCHHPIEFLLPEYANDRYTIQRDARSIDFYFLGITNMFWINLYILFQSCLIKFQEYFNSFEFQNYIEIFAYVEASLDLARIVN